MSFHNYGKYQSSLSNNKPTLNYQYSLKKYEKEKEELENASLSSTSSADKKSSSINSNEISSDNLSEDEKDNNQFEKNSHLRKEEHEPSSEDLDSEPEDQNIRYSEKVDKLEKTDKPEKIRPYEEFTLQKKVRENFEKKLDHSVIKSSAKRESPYSSEIINREKQEEPKFKENDKSSNPNLRNLIKEINKDLDAIEASLEKKFKFYKNNLFKK